MSSDFLRYTLIFLLKDHAVLMLHRRNPPNQGLWNGVGGRIEPGEGPLECAMREVREETGLQVVSLHYAGVVSWDGFETPPGGLYLFTAPAPDGEVVSNGEGVLAWKDLDWIFSSKEVVSNIAIFGPIALSGAPAREYLFHYRAGEIQSYEIRELPPEWSL